MTKLAIAASLTLLLSCAASSDVAAQTPPGFPRVVEALKTSPGCLGVDTGQTASGRQVIFAWFESKKALVDWYHSDVHQRAMKTAFPEQAFDRQPLPDLPDDTGTILAIVSVKFSGTPDARPRMSSIGVELYGPLPGGIAVGGQFALETIKIRGLRELTIDAASRASR